MVVVSNIHILFITTILHFRIMNYRVSAITNMLNDPHVKVYEDGDGKLIVEGNVVILNDNFNKFPVKIDKVIGSVEWRGCVNQFESGSLTSLENFPDEVTGNVYISKNVRLTSLNGCPKKIGGSLVCDHCNISDISGIAGAKIKNHFIASHNPISDISVLEKVYVGRNIELINTPWSRNSADGNISTMNDSSIIVIDESYIGIYD